MLSLRVPRLIGRRWSRRRSRCSQAAGAHRGRLRVVLGIGSSSSLPNLPSGWPLRSLALLADAGHVFADVVGTTLALAAIWLAARPATSRRSFGFYRTEILAAVLVAVLLFAIAALVLIEAYRRLFAAPDIATGPVIAVAAAALVANGVGALILRGAQRESLTLRGAYVEILGDALGAAAVLVAAVVIALTGFRQADALALRVHRAVDPAPDVGLAPRRRGCTPRSHAEGRRHGPRARAPPRGARCAFGP